MSVEAWLEPFYQSWWRVIATPILAFIIIVLAAFLPFFWLSALIIFLINLSLSFFGSYLLFSPIPKFDPKKVYRQTIWHSAQGKIADEIESMIQQNFITQMTAESNGFQQHDKNAQRRFCLGALLAFGSVAGSSILLFAFP